MGVGKVPQNISSKGFQKQWQLGDLTESGLNVKVNLQETGFLVRLHLGRVRVNSISSTSNSTA